MATATATKTRIKPLGDKVLVKRAEAETKTKTGIFLPEAAKEKPQEAEVLAIGDGKLLDNGQRAKFQVKVGDRILLSKWGGTEIKVDDQELLIISEDDILGVIG
ncbi:MAG: co-chaperone GroES [Phycisphaeraceae bacterium]|nr:co-chaperone GroES [Phycisphaeraceae bacterium]MCC7406690.1 co-chaperone GroES [Phycisphaeraceae bacterium]